MAQLSARCPHVRNETRVHEYYVRALLQFATIDPANLASLLLPLVVEATLKVDLDTADYGSECGSEVDEDELADDDELFEFDDDEPPAVEEEEVEVEEEVAVELEREEEEPASHRLDVMMSLTLEFLHHVAAQDVRVAQALFQTLWQSFETTILPTYQTKHVQYLLFYICSLEEALPSAFIERLLTKALSVGAPLLVRQTAVAYVGSYVSRANYVDMACTRGALTALCGWLNEYIRDQATVADPQVRQLRHNFDHFSRISRLLHLPRAPCEVLTHPFAHSPTHLLTRPSSLFFGGRGFYFVLLFYSAHPRFISLTHFHFTVFCM